MPDLENLPLNPWLLAGSALALVALIFYIGRWVGDVNAFKSGTVVGLLKDIRDDIKTLLDRVPPIHIARTSPLRLTELGEAVSKALDGPVWMQTVADELAERIGAGDMSPYDIQEFCLSYMREDFDPTHDQGELIKRCAYDNGLSHQQVLEVLAIELRDRLLAAFPQGQASAST